MADGYLVRAKARGMCMAPLILRGDLLTVRPAAFAEYWDYHVAQGRRRIYPARHWRATRNVVPKQPHPGH